MSLQDYKGLEIPVDAPAQEGARATIDNFKKIADDLEKLKEVVLTYTIDGGGAVIDTGVKNPFEIPFDGTLKEVRLLADQAGDIVIDLAKDTFANYPPAFPADSIVGGGTKPSLSSADKYEDTVLTSWNTAFSKGDILVANVDSVTTIEAVAVVLVFTRD